jgi:hypothetical protein
MTEKVVEIEGYCDGFSVTVDGVNFYFSQEDSVEGLKDMFEELGVNATYQEVY